MLQRPGLRRSRNNCPLADLSFQKKTGDGTSWGNNESLDSVNPKLIDPNRVVAAGRRFATRFVRHICRIERALELSWRKVVALHTTIDRVPAIETEEEKLQMLFSFFFFFSPFFWESFLVQTNRGNSAELNCRRTVSFPNCNVWSSWMDEKVELISRHFFRWNFTSDCLVVIDDSEYTIGHKRWKCHVEKHHCRLYLRKRTTFLACGVKLILGKVWTGRKTIGKSGWR